MIFPSTAPAKHRKFLEEALPILQNDTRIVGVACAGSFANNTLDEHSDLDLVIAIDPSHVQEVTADRFNIVAQLGTVAAAFTGEHVGEPRLIIALYGPDALHVDFKFLKVEDATYRVDEPVILWARDERLEQALSKGTGKYPPLDEQWVEDRFWVWVHYCSEKIARGEYFEALEMLGFLRMQVLGPLAMQRQGYEARGLRKIETLLPEFADKLKATVVQPERSDLQKATELVAALYLELQNPEITKREEARKLALQTLSDL